MAERDFMDKILPEPIVLQGPGNLDELLAKEWVLGNRLGSYASASAAGANTRRYHGLLVSSTLPPVGRIVSLSCLLDQFIPTAEGPEQTYDLATFEFDHAVLPNAQPLLEQFRLGASVEHIFRCGSSRVVREILLHDSANAVAVRYRLLEGPGGRLRIRPFAALRDFHGLRHSDNPQQMTFRTEEGDVIVEDRQIQSHALRVNVRSDRADQKAGANTGKAAFAPSAQWWYRFRYRGDLARGHEGYEDLYTPGDFEIDLKAGQAVQLTACLGEPMELNFTAMLSQKRGRLARIVESLGEGADLLTQRLAVGTDLFLADRNWPMPRTGKTILAGFHWFADWGRDTMISLPGLLLETGRFDEALDVLRTFAAAIQNGMIPNRFDDYAQAAHYNSIDASLWFVIAADRYVTASGNEVAWANELQGPVERIVQAYHDGTLFDIHADADGLLTGGSEQTQLTWMDVKLAGISVTPRHGKCVEVNALWHSALGIAARRCTDARKAQILADQAQKVAGVFSSTFWNPTTGGLYDCVIGQWKDGTIRPNQVIAVAMPDCPLPPDQQKSVVHLVQEQLLTPVGLRTISPFDSRYRGRFGNSLESRDRAYHQGMVWPWLMGPFIEAYLRVNDFSDAARGQARQWLAGFEQHLLEAGLGSISEVFDGDEPHAPGGCVAQAWSVAEVLRAKRLVDAARPAAPKAAKPKLRIRK